MEFTEYCRRELLPGVCQVTMRRKNSHLCRFTPTENDPQGYPSTLTESITPTNCSSSLKENCPTKVNSFSRCLLYFDKSLERIISSIKRDFSKSCQSLPMPCASKSEQETHKEIESISSSKNIEDFYEYTENCLALLDEFKNSSQYEANRQEIESMKVDIPFIDEMKKNHKRIAIFDLDETLMHRNIQNIENSEKIVTIHLPSHKIVKVGVNLRPHLIESLRKIQKKYYLIAFTASQQAYGDAVLNLIDPEKDIFSMRLFRHNCRQIKIEDQTVYVKDLRIMKGINLKDVVIIDNSILSFAYQLENGIPIVPYYEGKEDDELIFLSSFLLNISTEKDLRDKINSQIIKIYHDLE